jgi:hypothetical protein
MIGRSKDSLWKRAAIRFLGVAIVLLVSIELMRFTGRAQELDRVEQVLVALGGAAVYAIVWTLSAAMTARMLKKIADAAPGEKK